LNARKKSLPQPEKFLDPFVTDFYNEIHDLSQAIESPQSTEYEPHFYTPISDLWAICFNRKNLNFTQSVGMSEGFLKRLKFCFKTQVGLLSESGLINTLFVFKREDFGYDSRNHQFQIDYDAVMTYVVRLRDNPLLKENSKRNFHSSILSVARWSAQHLKPNDQLFTKQAFELLKKSNFKSVSAPAHDDSEKGRYDLPTLILLQERIRSEWNQGVSSELTREEFLLVLLLFAFGARPIQLSQLKVSDLVVEQTEAGKIYTLHMPFVKQRKEAYRSRFEPFELENSLGELMEKHIVENGLSPDTGLFQFKGSPRLTISRRATGLFRGHVTKAYITVLMSSLEERLNLPFATNAKRFRSTVGTKMYLVLGPAFAGQILTHIYKDSINAYASLKVMADVIAGISRSIHGDSLDLLNATKSFLKNKEAIEAVDAFRGMVVPKIHHKAPELIDAEVSILPRGACGTVDGACTRKTVGLPYACYTCKSMLALSTGPHRVYLEHTIDLYIGLKKRGLDEQANQYLAPMFGMAQVINLVKKHGHD